MGVELGRVAAVRYRPFAITLAVLMALGLFFAAGVRDAGSWILFSLAALVAIVVPAKLVGAEPRRAGDHQANEPDVLLDEPSEAQPAVAPPARTSEPAPGSDDVDYLRALRHELRTPLNAVLGFSDVLLSGIDGEINASQREDLEIIRASGIRLRILLDSALDISQLAEGELRLDTERVDVRELVERAATEAGQLWSNKRMARFTLPDEPCSVEVDEARLRRSILVLADFLATSHRDADIAMSLTHSEDHVAIELSANSTERPSLEALPTTAEVLAAEDVTKIRQWPVAVTSELIGRHGGSLYHGSAPSRFMIRLPLGGLT
jgi:hypothetical protein